jgi:hypothetical protein
VDGYGGQRKTLWGFAHTAWGHTPGGPPVERRCVLVCDPAGKLRLDACGCPDRQVTPGHMLAGGGMRWSVEVTCEARRAQLGLETQRHGADQAMARPTPLLVALGSLIPRRALRRSRDGPLPVLVTAWYHKAAPTFSEGGTLVRQHLWRAR